MNPVGFTVWHALRNFDRTFTSVEGKSADDEVWQTGGFTVRSGYDPRGKGFRGSGMGTGYTQAQVAEVPATKELLAAYADALHAHVSAGIRAMSEEQLLAMTVNPTNLQGSQLIVAQRIIGNIGHGIQHLGEADVLRSLWGIPDPTTPQEEM